MTVQASASEGEPPPFLVAEFPEDMALHNFGDDATLQHDWTHRQDVVAQAHLASHRAGHEDLLPSLRT